MLIPLEKAISLIQTDQLVAVPTETVYGLAASIYSPVAIEKVFFLKGRPSNNPLIIHTSSIVQIVPFLSKIPEGFFPLAEHFWPGAMTLVLPILPERIDGVLRANLPTAAFRIPNQRQALALIEKTGPIVMPSANLSGRPSATRPEHVEHDFGKDFPILEGEGCSQGVESTILLYKENRWFIVRLGAIPAEAFESVLGYVPVYNVFKGDEAPLCPGQLFRHYAPKAKLILRRKFLDADSGVVLGFNLRSYPTRCRVIGLGETAEEWAKNLFGALRSLDQNQIEEALVDIDFPEEGLWLTIKERLKKAAS